MANIIVEFYCNNMATAHLLHGFIGSGKTTIANRMEREMDAIRFTYDEWMVKLYGSNPPASEFAELYCRIETLIWELATELLCKDIDVIIDSGFWSRDSRDRAKERVLAVGANPVIYKITCPEDLMRSRVLARTKSLPDGELWINEAAFDEFRTRFEPLQDDEDYISVSDESGQHVHRSGPLCKEVNFDAVQEIGLLCNTQPVATDCTILITHYHESDAPILCEVDGDPEHRKRFGFPRDFVPSLKHARGIIASWAKDHGNKKRFAFAVRNAKTGKLVGGCELKPLDWGAANVSYWVHPKHRRQGVASKAVMLLSTEVAPKYGFSILELLADADNTASLGVARNCNYVPSGMRNGQILYVFRPLSEKAPPETHH